MSIGKSAIPFTYEDYKSLPESRERYELMDGDFYVTPPPATRHQIISKNIQFLLESRVRAAGLGLVLSAPVGVVLGEGAHRSVVQPDLLFIDGARQSIVAETEVVGPPDLVVEILSPGTEERDRGLKKSLYARAGVRECWIVEPQGESIEVFTLGTAGSEAQARFERDDELTSTVVAGLRMPLAEVFRR